MKSRIWGESGAVSPFYVALQKVEQQETKFFTRKITPLPLKESLTEKIPPKVESSLALAFGKAFSVVFSQGTGIIEKTFDKESGEIEFAANDYVVGKRLSKKSLKRMDKMGKKSKFLNATVTTTTGVGLGFLGIGIPDIPLFIATLLKGIYETAISYGFDYSSVEEKKYILHLIRCAITRKMEVLNLDTTLEQDTEETAMLLAKTLLLEKFVQGIPVIGASGGIVNFMVYNDVSTLSGLWYKKRYLMAKLEEKPL